jgi:hypothetical protein
MLSWFRAKDALIIISSLKLKMTEQTSGTLDVVEQAKVTTTPSQTDDVATLVMTSFASLLSYKPLASSPPTIFTYLTELASSRSTFVTAPTLS